MRAIQILVQSPPELLLLPGHRRLPLGRVRDEQGEAEEAFLARKKKLAEKNTGTTPKPTKPTRRGKHGGLREIERTILKENMH